MRQQSAKQPVLFLGMGTCGLGAGAGRTLVAIKTYLANCGIVDPQNLDEYMVRGGHRALTKTLKSHTPDDTCDLIEVTSRTGLNFQAVTPTERGWGEGRRAPGQARPARITETRS